MIQKVYYSIIFDLDDTLVKTGIYYKKAREEFIDYSHNRTGVPKEVINKIFSGIDLACTDLPHGFNKERFPRSFSATSAVLDLIRDYDVDQTAVNESYDIGHSVFDAPYDMLDGVQDMLAKYKSTGRRLFMCTKGDIAVQQRKIDIHALDDIFPMEHIYIVPKKTPQEVIKIVDDHDLDKDSTIFVGDSLRDDIGSALSAGIDGVWVNAAHIPHWDYENKKDVIPTHVIEHITELPTFIPY